jgi:hypothetical protein
VPTLGVAWCDPCRCIGTLTR